MITNHKDSQTWFADPTTKIKTKAKPIFVTNTKKLLKYQIGYYENKIHTKETNDKTFRN